MPEEKLEEETYSLIFTSLKHPIRRRILRMLANGHLTFSEILESLSIDSGHLSYHLENLGDLVTRSQDGKYGLSSIGIAAVKLMSGVEEHPAVPSRKESKTMLSVANVYGLILVGIVIVASLYFVNFTASVLGSGTERSGMPIIISPNQSYKFNITLVYREGADYHRAENNGHYEERAPPISTLTMWETGGFAFDLESNETFTVRITNYSPDGKVRSSREDYMASGADINGLGYTEITQAGTYRFEIENIGAQEMHGLLGFNLMWHLFKKPYFYYGIAGLVVSLFYPFLILLQLLRRRSSRT